MPHARSSAVLPSLLRHWVGSTRSSVTTATFAPRSVRSRPPCDRTTFSGIRPWSAKIAVSTTLRVTTSSMTAAVTALTSGLHPALTSGLHPALTSGARLALTSEPHRRPSPWSRRRLLSAAHRAPDARQHPLCTSAAAPSTRRDWPGNAPWRWWSHAQRRQVDNRLVRGKSAISLVRTAAPRSRERSAWRSGLGCRLARGRSSDAPEARFRIKLGGAAPLCTGTG